MKKRLFSIWLTICIILSLAPAALAEDAVFADVKTDDWFAHEVKYVYDHKLMDGVGGTYTNVGAGSDDHYDLIYAKNGGTVEINGGTFSCQTPNWTLNKHDSTNSSIVVKGGTFIGYNPSVSNTENPTANFVAEGYVAVEDDGSWTVTKISYE